MTTALKRLPPSSSILRICSAVKILPDTVNMSDQQLQPVRHCEDTSRFVLRLDADSEAVLKYKRWAL